MIDGFFLTQWFFSLLRWLTSVLGNSYVGAILLTTLFLRLLQIYPDIMNRKTQKKQQAIQPELEKLQKKYENNPQKLNEEQRKLMKANGVNMLAGCLPMLITLPLFFCFLSAFRYWSYERDVILLYETVVCEEAEAAGESSDLAERTFESYRFLWITNIWQPDSFSDVCADPAKIRSRTPRKGGSCSCSCSSETDLQGLVVFNKGYTDLDGNKVAAEDIWETLKNRGLVSGEFGKESMNMLPEGLTANGDGKTADEIYNELMSRYDTGYTNGMFILPVLAAAFQFLAAWLPTKLNKDQQSSNSQQEKSMKFMLWIFPIMSFVFCLTEGAAFALYWVASSVFQLLSTLIISYIMSKDKTVIEVKPIPKETKNRRR